MCEVTFGTANQRRAPCQFTSTRPAATNSAARKNSGPSRSPSTDSDPSRSTGRVAVVASTLSAEQHRLAADVEAYQRTTEANASAATVRAAAEAKAEAARLEATGQSEAVKIRAQADSDAAALQAMSITKLAEARREEEAGPGFPRRDLFRLRRERSSSERTRCRR